MATVHDSDLGALLRYNVGRILLERGERPADLYRRIGWHRNTYASIFKGPGGPLLSTVRRLAEGLGVPIDELLRPRRGLEPTAPVTNPGPVEAGAMLDRVRA